MDRTEFNVILPLVKAGKGPDGQTWVHGVASDETLDLQGEVTLAAGLKRSIPYLEKFGKFNDDHRRLDVGEVMKASVVTKGELVGDGILDAGKVSETAMADEVLYVSGHLYKHVPRARHYRDVLRSGGRLGLSIQGAILQKEVEKSHTGSSYKVNRECFINKIAITDQPVNMNTWCALKKSFGGDRHSRGLMRVIAKGLRKALTTGAGIVQIGDTGGPALRKQSLEGAKRKRKRSKEGIRMDEPKFRNLVKTEKSLGGLSFNQLTTKVYNLLKAAEVFDSMVIEDAM